MEPARGTDGDVLTIIRIIPASCQTVFDAWTSAESVRHWMCPEAGSVALAELDVRVGGTFRVDMLAGNERTIHTGVYREVRPPEKLVFTWTSKLTHHRDTLVTVELRALGEHTQLTLTQTLLPDEIAVQQHTSGWTLLMAHLVTYIQTGLGTTASNNHMNGTG